MPQSLFMAARDHAADHPYTDTYFSSRYSGAKGRDQAWKSISNYLQRFIPVDGTVLDLGAGYCSFINHVRASNKHALDLYAGFSKYAMANVTTHVGTCRDLQMFAPGQFDAVFASNLLEHLTREATQDVLREVRRILKPQGRFIIVQPNFRYAFREYFDDYTHLQIFTHVGLADLLAAHGYRVEHVQPRFLPFSFKSRLPPWGWLVKLYLRLPFRPLAKQMLVVARPAGQG